MFSRILVGLLAMSVAATVWMTLQRNHYRQEVRVLRVKNAALQLEAAAATISATAQGQITQIDHAYQKEDTHEKNITDGNFTLTFDRLW